MQKNKPYTLALDIGVGSVGYAAIDNELNIMKYHNQDVIGSLIFEPANTAEERRLQRGARRRYNRRVKRLGLLQEVLDPLVDNPNFYHFENLHKWKNNNHDFRGKSLFDVMKFLGESSTKYPTIYHLQHELMTKDKKISGELIYIAIYHLVKYRGHFLFNQLDFNNRSGNEILDDMIELFERYSKLNGEEVKLKSDDYKEILHNLKNDDLTRNDRLKLLNKIDKHYKEVYKMLLGMKFNIGNLFINMDNYESIKEKFKNTIYLSDDIQIELAEVLTDKQMEFIEIANKVHMGLVLENILSGEVSISASKVKEYNQFKAQLKEVKDIIYNKDIKIFKEIFVSSKKALKEYHNTPSSNNLSSLSLFDQYLKYPKKIYPQLIKELKKHIPKSNNLYTLAEENKLLKVLNTVDNASIPMQNNLYEAETILTNQQKYHPEITDEMIEKVKSLIEFRIPYYVGPLVKQDKDNKFGWMIRNIDEKVTPWNFNEVVDKSTSAEKFIRRMTNKCQYLLNEDVIPKNSLLYQEMEVLNELNGAQLRLETDPKQKKYRFNPLIKQYIFENIFKKEKSVSHDLLLEKMKHSEYKNEFVGKSIYGTQDDKKFISKLSTYNDMKKIFNNVEENHEMIEEIVLWITIFEDKKILESKIKDNYPQITNSQMKQLLNLNYSGWGRLSEKLLTYEYRGHSIIERLKNTEQNFMEIISDKDYGFQEFISEENELKKDKITYSDVASLATSPALKKGVWNSIQIVREISELIGEPENIVMEFAREDGEKGLRQKSRKETWLDNIKLHKLDRDDAYSEIIKEAEHLDINFNDEKLWLYLSQKGRCLYTGERIILEKLIKDKGENLYEVDHIYPRRFVKDDSFNNKALVLKSANQNKSGDLMPLEIIPKSKVHDMKKFWEELEKNGLISNSKFFRLNMPKLTELNKEGFTQRQLVETRQISKHVRDFLEEEYSNTKVIPMKANLVSDFRYKAKIPKIRSLNDGHHAIDAYLVAVLYQASKLIYGNANLFEFNFKHHKVKEKWKNMNEDLNVKRKEDEFFYFKRIKNHIMDTGERLTDKIKSDINQFNINYSRKTGGQENAFYKQTGYSPKVNDPKYVSEKNDFIIYKEMKVHKSHAIHLIEENKKGKQTEKYTLIDEYVIEHYQFANLTKDEQALRLAKRDSKNKVLEAKYLFEINKGDLVYINSHPFYFISSSEVINAKQFEIPMDDQIKLKASLSDKSKLSSDEMNEIYRYLANKMIEEYPYIFPKNKEKAEVKKKKILEYFESTNMTLSDYQKCIGELLKVTSASSVRSEVLGGRISGLSDKAFFGAEDNAKIQYKSLTGLKKTKIKSLFKVAESKKNEF